MLHKLGEGGMGQVYAAYDPELDRRVAVKILHFGVGEPELAARLRQEGRALARLRHPNVVTVYDVGVAEEGLFIATELVDGVTVDRWLRNGRRTWREVLDVFVDVGEGVAAAHSEGLVHRDLKPGNMMVTGDGRGVVLDFGIARDAESSEGGVVDVADVGALGAGAVGQSPLGQPSFGQSSQTAPADALLERRASGTPAFMAPEQKAGEPVGPAADVYSYCLTLYYALYGQLPEEGDPTGETTDGHVPAALAGSGVPAALRRLARGGLRSEREQRPESMAALVRDLRRLRDRRGRLFRRGGVAILALVALAGIWLGQRGSRACAAAGEPIREVWNDSRSRGLEHAVLGTERPFAGEVWRTVRGALDAYAASWTESAESWCLAARDGSQSPELYDLRIECLGLRARDLEATLAVLEEDPARRLEGAVDMVSRLPRMSECLDIRALRAPVPPPQDAETTARLEELREGQARLRALWAAGDFEPAKDVAGELLVDARSLGYWPLIAELLHQRGLIEDASEEPAAAETLEEATMAAGAGHHVRITAESLIRLARVAGLQSQDFEAARAYAEQAASALGALGRPEDLAFRLEEQLGVNAQREGRYAEALGHLRTALEWKSEEFGPRHPEVADTLLRLGNAYVLLKEFAKARDHLDRALEIQLETVGPSHPAVAETHVTLGRLERASFQLEKALRHHRAAAAIYERVYGAESTKNGQSLTYLGELQALGGEKEEARRSFERALAIFRDTFGAGHGHVAVALSRMASAWTEAGDDAAALAPFREALEIYESIHDADHPDIGQLRFNLATVYLRLGRFAEAADGFEGAGNILRRSLGEDHPIVASALTGQGDALVRLGRARQALPLLRRAEEIDRAAAEPRNAKDRADTAFALARALSAVSGDDERARELAESALVLYRTVADASEREIADVELWLETGS